MKKFKKIITISALAIFSFFLSLFVSTSNISASESKYLLIETEFVHKDGSTNSVVNMSTTSISASGSASFELSIMARAINDSWEETSICYSGLRYDSVSKKVTKKNSTACNPITTSSHSLLAQGLYIDYSLTENMTLNELFSFAKGVSFNDIVNATLEYHNLNKDDLMITVTVWLRFKNITFTPIDMSLIPGLESGAGMLYSEIDKINCKIIHDSLTSDTTYDYNYEKGYDEGFIAGEESVDKDAIKKAGYDEGVASVDITKDNQEYADNYIKENNYHTDDDYQKYGEDQFNAGVNSVDKDALKQEGYDEGYEAGKAAGIASVDITADNEEAINKYIQDNNLKTEEEYNSYGESKYAEGKQAGIDSVDITSDNDRVIIKYIQDNNMKTLEEYNSYGESMYNQGKADGIASVDITSDNEAAINKYIQDNNLKTNSEYLEYGNQKYFDGYTAGAKSVDTESYRLIGYKEGYTDGVASVDITIDNQDAIDDYIKKNNMKTNADYLSYGETKYNEGLAKGTDNVYNNLDSDEVVKEYVIQYIKVNKYYTEKEFIDNYDDGYEAGYQVGYSKGLGDIESIRKKEYQDGYNEGYKVGFADGEYSVDITTDNDEAIEIYIRTNKYHTDYEFNLNYDLGMNFGINYVYNNLDVDLTIQEYVKNYIEKNNYYTEKEFIDNYDSGYKKGYKLGYNEGYTLGKNSGGQVITDEVLVETIKEKLLNNLTINLKTVDANVGSILIKYYDVNVENNGDIRITINYIQDDYNIKTETVVEVEPGENTTTIIEKENNTEEVISLVIAAAAAIVGISLIIALLSLLGGKSKKKKMYVKKKDYLMKI